MERYNQIIENQTFVACMEQMELLEQNREYCRHGLTHLLDVCRVAYIFALEEESAQVIGGKDVIYAAGLLHDLGRVEQYRGGKDHNVASVELAQQILPECGYTDDETMQITQAIGNHRAKDSKDLLSQYIYRADKAVRNCFCCVAAGTCNWDETKKNKGIV